MKVAKKQEEIGRITLSDSQELVVSVVDDERLDLRLWVKTDSYTGPTKRGRRFLFDEIWEHFKGLMEAVDKVYKELA